MGRVLTNNVGLAVTVETSGTPGTIWLLMQPNTIGAYGAQITSRARRPISNTRGRRKGAVVDLDSSVEFESDLTFEAFAYFIEGFVFSEFANREFDLRSSSGTLPPPAVDGGGSNDSFTIDAASTLLAGKVVYNASGAITLVYAKGYTNAANNGVFALAADVAGSGTAVEVATGTLVAETPPVNASLQVCGVRVTDGDLTFTRNGSTATLASGGDITSWATLGVRVGMLIYIGGINTATGAVTNALNDSAADDTYGIARVTGGVSTATLTLDKLSPTLAAASNATGISHSGDGVADVLFGRFARNVATTADSDDTRYLERQYQFEAEYPGIAANGVDSEFEYAISNYASELTLNVPLTDLATMALSFVGTSSDPFVAAGSRKSGASAARTPLRQTAFSTASDLVSISTDLISSASDVCFKSMTFAILNNVSPEKCLGTLGATFVNAGLFEFNIEGQLAFTTSAIIAAIRNNTTVTFGSVFRNEDGMIGIDVPEMTVSGGGREFPVDQTVLVNLTGESYTSNTFGHDVGVSLLPVAPAAV